MTPSAIGPVKAALLGIDLAAMRDFLMPMVDKRTTGFRAPGVQAFVEKHGVPL